MINIYKMRSWGLDHPAGYWQVVISSNQLSNYIRKRGSWGTNGHHLGIVFYIKGASSYKLVQWGFNTDEATLGKQDILLLLLCIIITHKHCSDYQDSRFKIQDFIVHNANTEICLIHW